MEISEVVKITSSAKEGAKLRLTFNPGSGKDMRLDGKTKRSLQALLTIHEDRQIGFLILDDSHLLSPYAVIKEGHYGGEDLNRYVRITLGPNFNHTDFASKLHQGLEAIEITAE